MSELCIVNLKEHKLDYEKLNSMANHLMKVALDNNIAVFFHAYDYGNELIQDAKMKNFFLMSDSFLYKNCDFLDTTIFKNVSDIELFRKEFLERFRFFDAILQTVFEYDVEMVEIYITEDGSVDCEKDFAEVYTTQREFLRDLFCDIINNVRWYAYCFPTTKFIVRRDNG